MYSHLTSVRRLSFAAVTLVLVGIYGVYFFPPAQSRRVPMGANRRKLKLKLRRMGRATSSQGDDPVNTERPSEVSRHEVGRQEVAAEWSGAKSRNVPYNSHEDCSSDRWQNKNRTLPCEDLQSSLMRQLIFVSEEQSARYVYCAIPKNGCTYHFALLLRVHGEKRYEKTAVIHDADRKEGMLLSARNSRSIRAILEDKYFPKYVVVRNPLIRILSAYLDKVEPYISENQTAAKTFHDWIYHEYPVDLPGDRDWSKVNVHWKPQTEFCGFRWGLASRRFRMLRFERPEEYVDFLYDVLPSRYLRDGWRGSDNLSFRDHVLGPRERTGNTEEKVASYFTTPALFDHVVNVLTVDIRLLGYETDISELRSSLSNTVWSKTL